VIQQQPSEQLIRIDEPQDVYSATTLIANIREALLKTGNLRVDLQRARHIHAAVLQVLIAAQRSCTTSERSLAICGAAPEIETLLMMACLNISNPD
jgi:anti-anti-sigma regulatory factor